MDLSPYLAASGERILKGITGKVHSGKGEITIAKAAVVGIDRHLIALLMAVVDELGLMMSLNSLDTGQGVHVPGSRHFDGRAADCNRIGVKGGPLMPATLLNKHAVRYVEYLLAHGFQVGEGGPHAAILFGPVGSRWNTSKLSHTTHVHTSIFKRALPGAMAGEEEDADSCGVEVVEKINPGKEEGLEVSKQKREQGQCLSSLPAPSAFRQRVPPPYAVTRWSR